MIKTVQYAPQYFDSSEQVYVSNNSEMKCRVLKQYIQHWLARGLGFREFLAPCPGGWDVHPVNTADLDNIYHVIADSQRGPMAISMKNTICVKFHVDPRYPETCNILTNFVVHMSEKIYTEKNRGDKPLSQTNAPGGFAKPLVHSGSSTRVAQAGHHHIPFNTARHSGFTFSKRGGPVLVMNNATTANTWKLGSTEESESSIDDSSVSFVQKKSPTSMAKKHKRAISLGQTRRGILKPQPEETPVEAKEVIWSKNDIREFLHPGYQVNERARTARYIRPKVTLKYSAFPFLPNSRSSSVRQSPEVDGESQINTQRKPEERKAGWVSQADFKRVFPTSRGRLSQRSSPDPPDPPTYPMLYRFREEKKSAWIAGCFKS